MEGNKEISLKIKELAKIRRKIRQNRIYAFRLSLQDSQDFDNNPYQDEISELQHQEILILQEIQFLKRQVKDKLNLKNSLLPSFYVTFQGGS